jgi:hypothetical protein
MAERVFTDDERESAQQNRRESRRRLAEEASAAVDQLCAEAARPLPAWALAHAAKARGGKLLSLIALKCGDCTNWRKAEIAGCTETSCPLHPVRPYRSG